MLLTRINSKFTVQKEERIILGGCNILSHDSTLLGYKIPIPQNAIERKKMNVNYLFLLDLTRSTSRLRADVSLNK